MVAGYEQASAGIVAGWGVVGKLNRTNLDDAISAE
jgi:hypothetical protein